MDIGVPRKVKSKPPLFKHEKAKHSTEAAGLRIQSMENSTNRGRSNREKKMVLLRDVERLKKKLRYEQSVQRALQRALRRPLGALPRLPPCLSPDLFKLVAEVAVLEEEIVHLEQRAMKFKKPETLLCFDRRKKETTIL